MREGECNRAIVERSRKGDDVLDRLTRLVRDNRVVAGSFTGIGRVAKAEVGFCVGDGQYSTIACVGPLKSCPALGT